MFNLQIDGQTEFADAQNGDTTGPVVVSAGSSIDPDPVGDTHTVGETAGTGTNFSLYDEEIICEDRDGDTASTAGPGPLDVFVEPDDTWVCRIRNTYLVTPTATFTATPTNTATPTSTATFTATPTNTATATPTETIPVATDPIVTVTPTETSPPVSQTDTPVPPTNTPVTPTNTPVPPSPTPVPTFAQPTPIATQEVLIPETGVDLSLANMESVFTVWIAISLALGFVGGGMIFYGVATRLFFKGTKK
jgi:hypothetical protein